MNSVERQVRLLLRAWPELDRLERGEEIVSTTLDLVPAGRKALPVVLAASLAFGGGVARWRARPPIRHWYRYALYGRLPPAWHRWLLNDLFTRGWSRRGVARMFTAPMAFVCLFTLMIRPIHSFVGLDDWHPPFAQLVSSSIMFLVTAHVVGSLVGVAVEGSRWARRGRVEVLATNGYDEWRPPDAGA